MITTVKIGLFCARFTAGGEFIVTTAKIKPIYLNMFTVQLLLTVDQGIRDGDNAAYMGLLSHPRGNIGVRIRKEE